jgi:hypothetical protein
MMLNQGGQDLGDELLVVLEDTAGLSWVDDQPGIGGHIGGVRAAPSSWSPLATGRCLDGRQVVGGVQPPEVMAQRARPACREWVGQVLGAFSEAGGILRSFLRRCAGRRGSGGGPCGSQRGAPPTMNGIFRCRLRGPVPAAIRRTSSSLQGDHLNHPPSEAEQVDLVMPRGARMKATASAPICSRWTGTARPGARLSSAITWCCARPVDDRGSQSSRTAVKWCRRPPPRRMRSPSSRPGEGVQVDGMNQVGVSRQVLMSGSLFDGAGAGMGRASGRATSGIRRSPAGRASGSGQAGRATSTPGATQTGGSPLETIDDRVTPTGVTLEHG